MPWDLTGNAGTNATHDFVGTTDKRPLVIRTRGVERARILTNGYLGLGTKTPGARLTIANGGAFINGVSVGVDAPGLNYDYEYETVGVKDPRWNLRLQSPGSIFFHTGGNPPAQNVVVTAGGRIGVGSATPDARLTAQDVGPSRGGALDQAAIIGRMSNPAPVGNGGETAGVRGVNDEGHGVQGQSVSSVGVEGTSQTGTAIFAECQSGRGLFARTISGPHAGFFAGNVHINGSLSKPGGGFAIDHPLDPVNRYLNHSFVESPERKNLYDGVVALDDEGRAEVALPEWFAALNRDLRYQLTAIGVPAPSLHVARELANGRFWIAGGAAGQTVSWQVSGIRDDAWARGNPLEVEEAKTGDERGRYLHPELYGHTEEQSVYWPWLPRRRVQAEAD
jgi:hypothetical protein